MKETRPMTDDILETPSSTPNFRTELAAQLAELMPEVVADGKIDVVKLQELLGEDSSGGGLTLSDSACSGPVKPAR